MGEDAERSHAEEMETRLFLVTTIIRTPCFVAAQLWREDVPRSKIDYVILWPVGKRRKRLEQFDNLKSRTRGVNGGD